MESDQIPHQNAGDEGSEEYIPSFPIPFIQQTSPNKNEQSGDIHKPSRRGTATKTLRVDVGHPSVVLSEQNIVSRDQIPGKMVCPGGDQYYWSFW